MINFLALVALLATVASAGWLPTKSIHDSSLLGRPKGRIINGTETTIEAVPHQVSIEITSFGHWCGGCIISKYWVLTAAHCLEYKIDFYIVRAGTAQRRTGGSVHRPVKFVIHDDFLITMWGTANNDIALIRVEEPFKYDETRKPISLYGQDEEAVVGSIAVITGWGTTVYGDPHYLNLVQVPIFPKDKCNQLNAHVGGIDEGQICTAYENGGKGSCHGDSGGPLTINARLAGIVSWSDGCALPQHPTVYTEVAHFRDWINNNSDL